MTRVDVTRAPAARPGRRIVVAAAIAVLTLALAGCSENNEVGGGIDTGQLGGGEGGPRLGETTTTAAPATTVATTAPPTTARATATTAARATTTTAPQVSIEIRITKAAPFFDPNQAVVPRGGIVRWVNTDDQPRSVASEGVFASPPIPPGGRYEFRAGQPGTYTYSDPDRPFATGQLQVR